MGKTKGKTVNHVVNYRIRYFCKYFVSAKGVGHKLILKSHTRSAYILMLAGRAGSPIIFQVKHHSARLFGSSLKIMSHEQPIWNPPSRQTAEPVLKLYNTLTRTKVRAFKYRACDNAHPPHVFVSRTSSFQVKEGALNGTTAALPYTMLRIWATRGRFCLV